MDTALLLWADSSRETSLSSDPILIHSPGLLFRAVLGAKGQRSRWHQVLSFVELTDRAEDHMYAVQGASVVQGKG